MSLSLGTLASRKTSSRSDLGHQKASNTTSGQLSYQTRIHFVYNVPSIRGNCGLAIVAFSKRCEDVLGIGRPGAHVIWLEAAYHAAGTACSVAQRGRSHIIALSCQQSLFKPVQAHPAPVDGPLPHRAAIRGIAQNMLDSTCMRTRRLVFLRQPGPLDSLPPEPLERSADEMHDVLSMRH